eukprot:242022_1
MTTSDSLQVETLFEWKSSDDTKHNVELFGSWNSYAGGDQLEFQGNRIFACKINVPLGSHMYRFLVDTKKWEINTDASESLISGYNQITVINESISVELNVNNEQKKDDQQIVSTIKSKLDDEACQTLQWNGFVDVISAILLIIIGVITVYFIYSFRETNKKRYTIVTCVYFIISATMSILLNNSNISTIKVILILFI